MRVTTWLGASLSTPSVAAAAAQLDIPADCIVLLPATGDGGNSYFLFDKRALAAGCPPPPPPPPPPGPLENAPPSTAAFAARLERADALLAAAKYRAEAINTSCMAQRGALAALDAALANLRDASAQGAATSGGGNGWAVVARAVGAERAACEGLPTGRVARGCGSAGGCRRGAERLSVCAAPGGALAHDGEPRRGALCRPRVDASRRHGGG